MFAVFSFVCVSVGPNTATPKSVNKALGKSSSSYEVEVDQNVDRSASPKKSVSTDPSMFTSSCVLLFSYMPLSKDR